MFEPTAHARTRRAAPLPVEPEGDPGDDHDEGGGDVNLYEVVAHRANKLDLTGQPGVVACRI